MLLVFFFLECWEWSRCKDLYFGAPSFGVLFFAIRRLQKGKIDPNLLPRTPFRPRKKKSKEANRSTNTSEAKDEVLTAPSMADDLGKKVE